MIEVLNSTRSNAQHALKKRYEHCTDSFPSLLERKRGIVNQIKSSIKSAAACSIQLRGLFIPHTKSVIHRNHKPREHVHTRTQRYISHDGRNLALHSNCDQCFVGRRQGKHNSAFWRIRTIPYKNDDSIENETSRDPETLVVQQYQTKKSKRCQDDSTRSFDPEHRCQQSLQQSGEESRCFEVVFLSV